MQENVIKTDAGGEIYPNRIYELIDEYASTLDNPDEMHRQKSLVTGALKYCYMNYIKDVLNNVYKSGNRYNDIDLLDNLFNIYSAIAYKYNYRLTILGFCIFTGIDEERIYKWINSIDRSLNTKYQASAKRWVKECELSLVNDNDVVKSIFLLKAKHGYNDNLQAIPLDQQPQRIGADALPVLSLHNDNTGIGQLPIIDNKPTETPENP